MERQASLPGLEPDVRERTLLALIATLRELNLLKPEQNGLPEALKIYARLLEENLLIEDAPVETAVELDLVRTCMAMPEQYDVFRAGRQIGYLRLRHGHFRAHYPDHSSDSVVYETGTRGDGAFYDDDERTKELTEAAIALLKADGVEHPLPILAIPPYEIDDWTDDLGILAERIRHLRSDGKQT